MYVHMSVSKRTVQFNDKLLEMQKKFQQIFQQKEGEMHDKLLNIRSL